MFRKFLSFISVIILFANLSFAQTQEPRADIARMKFNLTNLRKPSQWSIQNGLLEFSSDNKLFAASGTHGEIQIYDIQSAKLLSKIAPHKNELFGAFSFSPDVKTALVQGLLDKKLVLFNVENGESIREFNSSKKVDRGFPYTSSVGGIQMRSAPITSDWKNILIGINAGEYELVDFESGKVKFALHHADEPNHVKEAFKIASSIFTGGNFGVFLRNSSFSPDGKLAIIANGNNSPTLWSVETGKLIAKLEPQSDRVYSAFFTSDSRTAITYNTNGIASVWETETGKMVASFGGNKYKAFPTAISSGKVVTINLLRTVWNDNKDAQVWDLTNGKLLYTLENCEPSNVSFSPDGKLILTSPSRNKKELAQIWDAETGKLISTLPRKDEAIILSSIWSPDSSFLITASKDFAKIWNIKGELLQTLENAEYPIELSRDGKMLATGGRKDEGYLWEITWK